VSAGSYEVELAVDTADIDAVEVGQEVELTISTDTAGTTTSDTSGFPGGGPPGGFPGARAQVGSDESDQDDATDDDAAADDVTTTGTVAEVGRVADASSGVATYSVLVTFSADADQVWVGSAATAAIQVSTRTGVTQVSSRAVSTVDGESVVTVAVDGTADGSTEQRSVELGETSGDMVEVVSGLEPGEFVIVELPSFGGGAGARMPGGGELPDGMQLPSGAAQREVAGTEEGS
jgi:macrolide-specific efflux system membrane fusion protein